MYSNAHLEKVPPSQTLDARNCSPLFISNARRLNDPQSPFLLGVNLEEAPVYTHVYAGTGSASKPGLPFTHYATSPKLWPLATKVNRGGVTKTLHLARERLI